MTDPSLSTDREPVMLEPGAGRRYPMGAVSVVFKADGSETAGSYSVLEWWLEPHTQGHHPHNHPPDDVFFVIDGTVSFLVGDQWFDAPVGSFILVPGGVEHAFENRGDAPAGILNISAPDLEQRIPAMAEWFRQGQPGNSTG